MKHAPALSDRAHRVVEHCRDCRLDRPPPAIVHNCLRVRERAQSLGSTCVHCRQWLLFLSITVLATHRTGHSRCTSCHRTADLGCRYVWRCLKVSPQSQSVAGRTSSTHFNFQMQIQEHIRHMSARPTLGASTERRITHVEDPEIVDGNHATLEALCDLQTLVLDRAKHACAKSVSSAIRDFDCLLDRLVLDHQADGRKHYMNNKYSDSPHLSILTTYAQSGRYLNKGRRPRRA